MAMNGTFESILQLLLIHKHPTEDYHAGRNIAVEDEFSKSGCYDGWVPFAYEFSGCSVAVIAERTNGRITKRSFSRS